MGTISLAEIELPCFVLEDGSRVLSNRGIVNALGMSWHGGSNLKAKLSKSRLEPYVSSELLVGVKKAIRFTHTEGGGVGEGYEARVLTRFCSTILAARRNNALHYTQAPMADRCEVILGATAEVGIVALVDEATGYQAERPQDALARVFLRAYAKRWEKTFPDAFFHHLCRLLRVKYRGPGFPLPLIVGRQIKNIVYSRLAMGVIEQLEDLNPVDENGYRKHKHHQFMTQNEGTRALDVHISVCMALMANSATWPQFIAKLDAYSPVKNGQYVMAGTTG